MRTRQVFPEAKQRRSSKYDHLVGQQLGTRVVLESLPRSLFRVECVVCGYETFQRGNDLESLSSKSCIQCLMKSRDANAKTVFNRVKGNAKTRGIYFNLTIDDFIGIASQNCFYCNEPPVQKYNFRERGRPYNGLDRVDNGLGYTLDNSVSCCPICNYAKHDLSISEFKEWLTKCYSSFILKEGSDAKIISE